MRRLWALCLIAVLHSATANAEAVLAAVASNFNAAMDALVAEFEASTGHRVEVAYGSSGKLYAQITRGAPFHVFFSADRDKPGRLLRDGAAVAGSDFTYARGALVLWSPRPGFLQDGPRRLRTGDYQRLALANPRLAPYGRAALEVLDSLDLMESSRTRWVQGENIAQTWQFVHSGSAELGFVARSQWLAAGGGGSHWPVPAQHYAPIRQDAVLLARGEGNSAARELLQFLQGERAGQILAGLGYDPGGG